MMETERLHLRRLNEEDVPWLAALDSDPQVMRFIRAPSTMEQALADARLRIEWDRLHAEFGLWAMVDSSTGGIHGWVGLKPFTLVGAVDRNEIELGFRLKRESWGRGLAGEAGARLLDFGFNELRLPRVIGVAMAENAASKRVLESLGFRFKFQLHSDGHDWDNYECDAAPG